MLPLLLTITLLTAPTCAGLQAPVHGAIVEPFAPIGRYAGHWGVDFAVAPATVVAAADDGIVTFVGVVVGNRTVTIDHGGVKSSYSFLTRTLVSHGDRVVRGQPIGLSGHHGGRHALHFSTRIGGGYVDPEPLLACRADPGPGLWLRETYPPADAGNHGWNLRPTTRGASRRR
jgi:murein DD-endopeptidase MepM/ murein hydrolase activator NlpD